MVDSLDEFRRKNAAQFVRAKYALQVLGRTFILEMARELIVRTPGFDTGVPDYGKQYDATRYIPTGRLRGGWSWSLVGGGTTSKGRNAARWEDGPFSAYGVETLAAIKAQLEGQHMGGISYLVNDVGYADDIIRGENNHKHIGPRNFVDTARRAQFTVYERALVGMEAA